MLWCKGWEMGDELIQNEVPGLKEGMSSDEEAQSEEPKHHVDMELIFPGPWSYFSLGSLEWWSEILVCPSRTP